MAVKAPRRVKSQNTRKKIFDAAARLLEKHSEEYLTIANICDEAGISKGTFFYHFNSKDDLMLYYLQEGFDNFVADYREDAIKRAGDDAYLLVLYLYQEYLDYCQSMGIEFVSNYYQPKNKALDARGSMATPDTMNSLLKACMEGLLKAQRAGYVREDWSANDISYDCCSVVKGCVFEWCLTNGAIDLKAHMEHMLYAYFTNVVTASYRETFPFVEPPMA